MDITWHGDDCFKIKGKKTSLVLNPHDKAKGLKADFVMNSDEKNKVKVEGSERTFDWPGEYEIKGVPILGFQAWTKSRSKEGEEGGEGDSTNIFYFAIGKIKFCHLGKLGHTLTTEMVKEIEDVDVLMIDGGKESNLDLKKAVEIVEAIDPRVVISMGDDQTTLLKELGAVNLEATDKLTIKSRSELPDDKRQYVLLNQS
ncbi:MBL fold metallo-hydrolase [Candidatus Gracilibacteria bacterium]|nr:MBL fold metallo-hydrolase [Candidatus Gracilibacteria bacterium]